MRMFFNRTKPMEDAVWAIPSFELSVHDDGELGEGSEVVVMEPEASNQLPNPLDGVELRAVSGKEEQREVGLLRQTPSSVEHGVVIFGVVDDDDHASAGPYADSPQVTQKLPTSLGIEVAGRRQSAQLTVAQADRPEIADTFPHRSMEAHGVSDFRRNPHTASAAVLLEVNFIHRPQVDGGICCQQPEFFLPPLGRPDPLGRLLAEACRKPNRRKSLWHCRTRSVTPNCFFRNEDNNGPSHS